MQQNFARVAPPTRRNFVKYNGKDSVDFSDDEFLEVPYKHLTENKREYVLSKQLLRSGTSIGANVTEAKRGQSRADLVSKMAIALKEADETAYWLRLLYETQYLTNAEYESMSRDASELIALLVAICKTSNATN